jgi:hypothetical protein
MNLVAHQLTARKNEKTMEGITDQNLIILKEVELLQIKLIMLCTWRPNRALDFKDPDVIFGSQKLKTKLICIMDVGYHNKVEQIG